MNYQEWWNTKVVPILGVPKVLNATNAQLCNVARAVQQYDGVEGGFFARFELMCRKQFNHYAGSRFSNAGTWQWFFGAWARADENLSQHMDGVFVDTKPPVRSGVQYREPKLVEDPVPYNVIRAALERKRATGKYSE